MLPLSKGTRAHNIDTICIAYASHAQVHTLCTLHRHVCRRLLARLLGCGGDVDAREYDGSAATHAAAEEGQMDPYLDREHSA